MPRKSSIKKDDPPELEENSEDYRKKRDRNNLAVKRSRVKSKQKTVETVNRVNALRKENSLLEEKLASLSSHLDVLRTMFLAHAANKVEGSEVDTIDLQKLFGDEKDGDELNAPVKEKNKPNKKMRKI